MVCNFEPVRKVVSQGLFVLWAALVVHVHPALTVCAIRQACIRVGVTSFMPFAQFEEWIVKNREVPDFVATFLWCAWGNCPVWLFHMRCNVHWRRQACKMWWWRRWRQLWCFRHSGACFVFPLSTGFPSSSMSCFTKVFEYSTDCDVAFVSLAINAIEFARLAVLAT